MRLENSEFALYLLVDAALTLNRNSIVEKNSAKLLEALTSMTALDIKMYELFKGCLLLILAKSDNYSITTEVLMEYHPL
jgi:hypothetical protein